MHCAKCGAVVPEGAKFCTKCGSPVGERKLPATWPRRLGNFVLDEILLIILCYGIAGLIAYAITTNTGAILALVAFYSIPIFYYVLFEGVWGRTPAKWITKTKVVRHDGSSAHWGQLIGRTFARFIPFEPLSLLRSTPHGWHDHLSKTLVVPAHYTIEDVQSISPNDLKSANGALIVVGGVFVLLVLGIIGSIVLVSLGNARQKGADASVMSYVNSVRISMEIYASNNKDSYVGGCEDPEIAGALKSAALAGTNDETKYDCYAIEKEFLVIAPLRSAGYWCVDSTGTAAAVSRYPTGTERCADLPGIPAAQ